MVDALVRHWDATARQSDDASFHADDGMLSGIVQSEVQSSLDFMTDCFATIGLKMNANKTVFMSTLGRGVKPVHKKGPSRSRLSAFRC